VFKPQLAPREDPTSFPDYFKKLPFPLMCSPKLDGIRCIIDESLNARSRTWKLIPSNQVQNEFNHEAWTDGELISGPPTAHDVYNRTQSYVMSANKPGSLSYYLFDYCAPGWLLEPFYKRYEKVEQLCKTIDVFTLVEHEHIDNIEQLLEYEGKCLDAGYEGIMMRDPMGRYKCGRGTFREGIIFKLKRYAEDEGRIIGFVERKHNTNEQTRDALGYAERSSAQAGKVGTGMLGKFLVHFEGQVEEIASGNFNHAQLKEIWENKESYIGKYVKFKHFPHGVKDKLRFPRATGFRDEMDM
jgi:DNA ligase-1